MCIIAPYQITVSNHVFMEHFTKIIVVFVIKMDW
jgi:hypothetical protein